MGFSAFPDGGRFEALYGAWAGRRDVGGGAGERREGVRRRGVTRGGPRVREREGPRARGGAAAAGRAGGRAEVTVFPSRSPGCGGAEGWPRGQRRGLRPRGDRDGWQSSPGAQESALPLQPPPSPPGAHLLPDAFCRTGCNMAAATAASAPGS